MNDYLMLSLEPELSEEDKNFERLYLLTFKPHPPLEGIG